MMSHVKKKRSLYNKMAYEKKRRKTRRIVTPEFVRLSYSSVQDTKWKEIRHDSHLCHLSRGSFVNITDKLKEIYSTRTLQNLTLLDVRAGHCKGLQDVNELFCMKCVGLEVLVPNFNGSKMYLSTVIKRKEKAQIPFVPIHGNALFLNNFGGADIVFSFLRGTDSNLHYHLLNLFSKEKQANVFVTSQKYTEDYLSTFGLERIAQLNQTRLAPLLISRILRD